MKSFLLTTQSLLLSLCAFSCLLSTNWASAQEFVASTHPAHYVPTRQKPAQADMNIRAGFNKKSIRDVFQQIETMTHLRFVYNTETVKNTPSVSVAEKTYELNDLLFLIGEQSQLQFKRFGNMISVAKKETENETGFEKKPEPVIPPISGTVKDGKGEPILGASVVIKGTTKGAVTDADGKFSLEANEGDILVISFVGFQAVEVKVGKGGSIDIVLSEDNNVLGEVAVVGSRSTAQRTSTETAAPVDVLNAKDLILTGQVEPTQQLQFIAPSFVSNRQTVADGTDHIDPASLRGLGPDQVLVLVNGKRRYQTALVNINGTVGKGSVGSDLNSIPAASIERIEVLRDGAASQYGSDAIAGVINVVLKKDTKGSANLHFGQQYEGDGRTLQAQISKGFKLGQKGGYINFSADLRHRDSTNRAGKFLGTVWNTNKATDDAIQARSKDSLWDRSNNMHVGNSNVRNYGVTANLGLPVGEKMDFYATLMGGYRNGKGAGFYRYPKQVSQVVKEIHPRGFMPEIHSTIWDRSVILGINNYRSKSGWRWDLSNTFGGNSFRFDVKNSNNASMGASSPTEFYCGQLTNNQNTTNFDIAKDFGSKMNLQSFNLAMGGEFRIDNFQIEAGDRPSWDNYLPDAQKNTKAGGAQVFPGYQPSNELNESRTVAGVYVDLETDLSKAFLVNAAARFENYSDFGSAFAGKLALRYKITDGFALRGAVSNGFRAPSIHQFYFNNVSTQFQLVGGVLSPSNTLTVRNDSPIAAALGIDPLKAEKSVNLSLGATARIGNVMTLTVDAYQIDIKDRILLAGLFRRTNATVKGILDAAKISNEVQVVQAFANILDTKTQGLDIVLAASPKLGKGTLDLTFAANFNKTDINAIKGTSKGIPAGFVDSNNIQFDRVEQSRVLWANPRDKFSFGANYRLPKGGFALRVTRFGKVGVWSTNRAIDEFYAAKFVADLSVNYLIAKNLRLTVGANNILDTYPDQLQWFRTGNNDLSNAFYGNTGEGRFVYSRNATQFGMNGGYWFAALNYQF
jgi:iron complex outermembrane receptor protein